MKEAAQYDVEILAPRVRDVKSTLGAVPGTFGLGVALVPSRWSHAIWCVRPQRGTSGGNPFVRGVIRVMGSPGHFLPSACWHSLQPASVNHSRPSAEGMWGARCYRDCFSWGLDDGGSQATHHGHHRPPGDGSTSRGILRNRGLPESRRGCGSEHRHPDGCGENWIRMLSAAKYCIDQKRGERSALFHRARVPCQSRVSLTSLTSIPPPRTVLSPYSRYR